MISIRVSADEYALVKREYTSRGIRSVSEFTREALHSAVGFPNHSASGWQTEARLLDSKIATLQGEVSRLSRIVAEGLLARLKD